MGGGGAHAQRKVDIGGAGPGHYGHIQYHIGEAGCWESGRQRARGGGQGRGVVICAWPAKGVIIVIFFAFPLFVRENALGAPHPRGRGLHQRHYSQTFDCISRTVEGQPGHSLLQAAVKEKLDNY
jgi:hypothetical protein